MSTIKTTNIQHPSAASPAVELTAAGGLWLGGGKILQVVRATDAIDRTSTTSTLADAGISVTITPTATSSAVLIAWNAVVAAPTGNANIRWQITDSSNNAISGAELGIFYDTNAGAAWSTIFQTAYDTPATTSATTYKVRFSVNSGTGTILNASQSTGQLFALEISA